MIVKSTLDSLPPPESWIHSASFEWPEKEPEPLTKQSGLLGNTRNTMLLGQTREVKTTRHWTFNNREKLFKPKITGRRRK